MSGIAGILRRDGAPVPEKWGHLLEQSLLFGGNSTFRFEDSVPVERGDLHILLLSCSDSMASESSERLALDGDIEGECSYARWNEETLELELGRKGMGQRALYWFDLADAGDGLLFCSNPLPLLQIARELELSSENLIQGVQEFLQLGFVEEGGEMLSPICSMPIQAISQSGSLPSSSFNCSFTTTPVKDVQLLVRVLGTPFADFDLLSTLQQYRYAKEIGCSVADGLIVPQPKRFFDRFFSVKKEVKEMASQRNAARTIELGAIARYVGIELSISPDRMRIEPMQFPLALWLRSPQSTLGQLVGDTLQSEGAFRDIPVDQSKCMQMLDAHRDGDADNSRELFAILTLALWSQQVHA
jgi:hypothetical protein